MPGKIGYSVNFLNFFKKYGHFFTDEILAVLLVQLLDIPNQNLTAAVFLAALVPVRSL